MGGVCSGILRCPCQQKQRGGGRWESNNNAVRAGKFLFRSEEGRGGEEGRSWWSPYHLKKKKQKRGGRNAKSQGAAIDKKRKVVGSEEVDTMRLHKNNSYRIKNSKISV